MANIKTKVAGVTFENRQSYIIGIQKAMESGKDIDMVLVRDMRNKADSNAVKVLARWKEGQAVVKRTQVGFLPKEVAANIAGLMDTGIFVSVKGFEIKTGSLKKGNTLVRGVKLVLEHK